MSIPWAPAAIIWAFSALALAEQLPDPTRPSGQAPAGSAKAAQLKLSAIIGDRAVINGQALKVGDRLGRVRVLAIASNSVTLANGHSRWQLTLFDTKSKKPTTCEGSRCGQDE
ncbi:hypothetical protein [Gallaecimonas sp. GXIMD4217]|uniref:hypothetical protein n=1 Tax=Gallaecimonas sp. GXIMD4217 TaxID=3131927 RepID=UPI00311AED50